MSRRFWERKYGKLIVDELQVLGDFTVDGSTIGMGLVMPMASFGTEGLLDPFALGNGIHYFPVPFDMTVTRIESTLAANGASALTGTLKVYEAGVGSWSFIGNVSAVGETLVPASELDGHIASIASPLVLAGQVLRLDIVAADALAESLTVVIYGTHT